MNQYLRDFVQNTHMIWNENLACHARIAPMRKTLGWPLLTQIILAGIVLLVTIAVPPSKGAMLILPMAPDRESTARWAINAGASILAAGPTTGSLIVLGERDRMAPAALKHTSLLIAAPLPHCGG